MTKVLEKSNFDFSKVIIEGGRLYVVIPKVLAIKYEANKATLSDDPLAIVTICFIFLLVIKLET